MNTNEHKAYSTPVLKKWGTVADLTLNGQSNPGTDGKDGSGPGKGV